MKRRTLLLGGLAAAAATTASAGIFDSIKTIVVGHTKDIASRLTEDEFVEGDVILGGAFDETAEGRDPIHWANGTVMIVRKDGKQYIQLHSDFNSGPLPDGWVTFSEIESDINTWHDFVSNEPVLVAPLKKGSGASYYEIPTQARPVSVTIICKQFEQYIGSAPVAKI